MSPPLWEGVKQMVVSLLGFQTPYKQSLALLCHSSGDLFPPWPAATLLPFGSLLTTCPICKKAKQAMSVEYLQSLKSVRETCTKVFSLAEKNELQYWDVDLGKQDSIVEFCCELIAVSAAEGCPYRESGSESWTMQAEHHLNSVVPARFRHKLRRDTAPVSN